MISGILQARMIPELAEEDGADRKEDRCPKKKKKNDSGAAGKDSPGVCEALQFGRTGTFLFFTGKTDHSQRHL